jgi:tetratricopeptide (TPR) repeat protein
LASERIDELVKAGQEALDAGDATAARRLFQSAITMTEQNFGPSSVELIDPVAFLGNAIKRESGVDALAQAIAAYNRALRITQEHSDPREAHLLTVLGNLYDAQGSSEEAVELLRRSLSLHESLGWKGEFTLVCLTHTLLKAGRATEALPYAEASMKLAEQSAESEDELIAPIIDVGLCLRDAGDRGGALPVFKRAHAIATARADVPELRDARASIVAEIQSWIDELEATADASSK